MRDAFRFRVSPGFLVRLVSYALPLRTLCLLVGAIGFDAATPTPKAGALPGCATVSSNRFATRPFNAPASRPTIEDSTA